MSHCDVTYKLQTISFVSLLLYYDVNTSVGYFTILLFQFLLPILVTKVTSVTSGILSIPNWNICRANNTNPMFCLLDPNARFRRPRGPAPLNISRISLNVQLVQMRCAKYGVVIIGCVLDIYMLFIVNSDSYKIRNE